MNEQELIECFKSCALPNGSFRHRDHVHVVLAYLRTMPLLPALERFSSALQRFATHHGKTSLYHATITWAFVDRYYRPETLASDLARRVFILLDLALSSST